MRILIPVGSDPAQERKRLPDAPPGGFSPLCGEGAFCTSVFFSPLYGDSEFYTPAFPRRFVAETLSILFYSVRRGYLSARFSFFAEKAPLIRSAPRGESDPLHGFFAPRR